MGHVMLNGPQCSCNQLREVATLLMTQIANHRGESTFVCS
jgi:hypothetical protein